MNLNKVVILSFFFVYKIICSDQSEQFTLLTSNVLMSTWYISYASNWVVSSQDRVQSFEKYIKTFKEKGVDVLCFQEWPYGAACGDNSDQQINILQGGKQESVKKSDLFASDDPLFCKLMNEVLEKEFPKSEYYYITDPYKGTEDGLLTLARKDKFKLLESRFLTTLKNDKPYEGEAINVVKLAFRKNPDKSVTVISTHLPWNSNNDKNIGLLKEFADNSDSTTRVICGDLNRCNSWDSDNDRVDENAILKLRNLLRGYRLSADDLPTPTTIDSSPTADTPLLLDYVIYSGGLKAVKKDTEPKDLNNLIKHHPKEKPTGELFYSDHAAVIYTFES